MATLTVNTTLANNAVTNAKLADMAEATIKGRADAAGSGDPQDLTADQVSTVLDGAADPFVRTSAMTGGGTPAGDDQEIQFNDSGAFGASPDFVWTGNLRIGNDSGNGTINLGNGDPGSTGTISAGGALHFETAYGSNLKITENAAWDFGGDIGESGKFLMSGGDFATPQWFQPQDNQIAVVNLDMAVVVCGSIPYPHVLRQAGTFNGRPSYGGAAATLRWDGVDEWEVFNVSANARLYSVAQDVATPDLITAAWTIGAGAAPVPGPILTYTETDNVADLLEELAGKQSLSNAANKSYVDGLVVGLLDDRGNYDASGNVWPSSGGSGAGGAILKGDVWRVSVAGTLGGELVDVGDNFRALANSPGQTNSNWALFAANTQQATTTVRGTLAVATTAEVQSSVTTNDTNAVTPIKWWQAFAIGFGNGSVTTAKIADNNVTLEKLQTIQSAHLLGRHGSGTGNVQQVGLNATLEIQGQNLQRAALTGDVTASAGSNSTTIANDAVTYAKMQNVSATDRLLGRSSAGAGDVEEITCTAQARALLDDATAADQRSTLGLGANGVQVCLCGTSITFTNQTNAEAFASTILLGSIFDTTGFTEVKLSTVVSVASASVNTPRIILKYNNSYSATLGNYSAIGTSEVSVSMSTVGVFETAWIPLAAGAIGTGKHLRLTVAGGDGAADPQVAMVYCNFR